MNPLTTFNFTKLAGQALQPKRCAGNPVSDLPGDQVEKLCPECGEQMAENQVPPGRTEDFIAGRDVDWVSQKEPHDVVWTCDGCKHAEAGDESARTAQSLIGDPVGVPTQDVGNVMNIQQPEYGDPSSQMNQDYTRPQHRSDTIGLDERQDANKPWGETIDTDAKPEGVGSGASWTQTGRRRDAKAETLCHNCVKPVERCMCRKQRCERCKALTETDAQGFVGGWECPQCRHGSPVLSLDKKIAQNPGPWMAGKGESRDNQNIIDMFIDDRFPKDKYPEWPRTGNLRITKKSGGWALVNYSTPILFRSNTEGAPIFFNSRRYSNTTSRIQSIIRKLGGHGLVEVDEDGIRGEIDRAANEEYERNEATPRSAIVLGKRSAAQNDMRFDCNARVEVWISADDIEFDDRYDAIVNNPQLSEEQKIAELKNVALSLAQEKISEASQTVGDISADISLTDVNTDRIDWETLVNPHRNDEPEEPFTPAGGGLPHHAVRHAARAPSKEELISLVGRYYKAHLDSKKGGIGVPQP